MSRDPHPAAAPDAGEQQDEQGENAKRFNDSMGCLSWNRRPASEHPGRCKCQGDDPTPHKHYAEPPYACARCSKCDGFQSIALPAHQERTEEKNDATSMGRQDTSADGQGRTVPDVSRDAAEGHRTLRGDGLLLPQVPEVREAAADSTTERVVALPAHQERTEPQEESEIVAILRERMRWYRDGCPDLEDTPVYFVSGDCARDAAGDLETALGEIERLTKAAPARAAEWQSIETAPKDGTRLLLFGVERGFLQPRVFTGAYVDGKWRGGVTIGIPTLWMHLPFPSEVDRRRPVPERDERLTIDELRTHYETVANALRDWINAQQITRDANSDPTIAPVYNAHVLLCELIRERFEQKRYTITAMAPGDEVDLYVVEDPNGEWVRHL